MSATDFNFDMSGDDFGAGFPAGELDENSPGYVPPANEGGEGGDDKDKAAQAAAAQAEVNKTLIAKLDKALADNETLRARFDTSLESTQERPQVTPPAPGVDIDALADKLADLQISNPREYQKQLLAANAAFMEQAVARSVGPAHQATTTIEIQNYRAANFTDDPNVREEFDSIINSPEYVKQLSTVSPQQRTQALAMVADMAYGRAARKGKFANARDNFPPDLGGGTGGGGSSSLKFKGKPLTMQQKLVVQMAAESGITDPKRIARMLADEDDN